MAELSEQRVTSGRFRTHDLADPLDWLPDQSVDLVLFALALEYVDDRIRALRELRRVLRLEGRLSCRVSIPPVTGSVMAEAISTCGSSKRPGVGAGGFGTGWLHLSRPARNCTNPAS
jgi:ubiquinone/menaquinone biosynthesis C-methylase UbiE